MKYHFGCGTDILPGYINCDSYEWPGVDKVIDLAEPDLEYGATEIFSNAFFEHLYVRQRYNHIESILGALAPGGFICYIGMPWFPGVAQAYLDKSPGTLRGHFDIYHVWRYTHGAPESAGYDYLFQLHKGLFDEEEYEDLFVRMGVDNSLVFTYVYPGEPEEVRVTSGMYISESDVDREELILDASIYLRQWDGKYLDYESVRFID